MTLSAQVGRRVPISTMLLAGVAIGSFASACTTFLMLRTPEGLRRAFNWLLGGYTGGGWEAVAVILPYIIVGLVVLQLNARALNVLQLDEDQARQLGINVERVKFTLVLAATLMTAAVVALGAMAPIQIGGCGRCSAGGTMRILLRWLNLPSKVTSSSDNRRWMRAMPSFRRAPRSVW